MKRLTTNKKVQNLDTYVATSRYKNTRYYQRNVYDLSGNIQNRIEPEIWNPIELEVKETDSYTQVLSGEEGRLDLVANRIYKNQALWWVIALANDIVDPFEEVIVGTDLRCPDFNYLVSALLL